MKINFLSLILVCAAFLFGFKSDSTKRLSQGFVGLSWGSNLETTRAVLQGYKSDILQETELKAELKKPEIQNTLKVQKIDMIETQSDEFTYWPFKSFLLFDSEVIGQLTFKDEKLVGADFHFLPKQNPAETLQRLENVLHRDFVFLKSDGQSLIFENMDSLAYLWASKENEEIQMTLSISSKDSASLQEQVVDFTE